MQEPCANKKGSGTPVVAQLNPQDGKPDNTLPTFDNLERYNIIKKIGDGAFSKVYRAKDKNEQYGEVAIKVVEKRLLNTSQRASVLKEVQIMRQLDHPNIAALVDFHDTPEHYFIVLELCPGGELFPQIVRLTYFSENLSRHIILQVAKAIQYLHETAGVVHRDIKPENILFYPIPFVPSKEPEHKAPGADNKAEEGEFTPGVGSGEIGHVKIADFGLSKVLWSEQTQTPCGTVGYAAPEVVKDQQYSNSVDMWALGCVLYTLLCGFPPFYHENLNVLSTRVARGEFAFTKPWWDDVSLEAQDLVSKLLVVDPSKRYDIKQFLAHPWMQQTQTPAATPKQTPATTPGVQTDAQGKALNPALQELRLNDGTDARSPGAVNIREVFGVASSVHRQEEERLQREQKQRLQQQQQKIPLPSPRNPIANAQADRMAQRGNVGVPPASAVAPAAAPSPADDVLRRNGYSRQSSATGKISKSGSEFKLGLGNATLLARRGKV